PIQTMCEVLDVPRSTYYQSLHKTVSDREQENNELTEQIVKIHKKSKKRYGAPKIHHELEKLGYTVSLKRVQRLMKKAGIRTIIVKKFSPNSTKKLIVKKETMLKQNYSTQNINKK